MGNHHSHKSGENTPNSSHNGSRKSIPRNSSASDIQEKVEKAEKSTEKPFDQMLPIERLAKILTDKAQAEDHVNGITKNVFYKYLFPRYPLLADKLYKHFYDHSNSKNDFITPPSFKQQCEKYLTVLDDSVILDTWVKMWSTFDEEKNSYVITPDAFNSLLMCAYHVSMDHYSEGPQMCLSINKTLKAVVDGCFYQKQSLSSQYVAHWLADNVSRLLLPLHRYAVHSIATAWRHIDQNEPAESTGLELTTPVLEQQQGPFGQSKNHNPHLLTMSMSWLLAGALPAIYSRPQKANSPSNSGTVSRVPVENRVCHTVTLDPSVRLGRSGTGCQPVPAPRPGLQGADSRHLPGGEQPEVLRVFAVRVEGVASLLGRGGIGGVSVVTQVSTARKRLETPLPKHHDPRLPPGSQGRIRSPSAHHHSRWRFRENRMEEDSVLHRDDRGVGLRRSGAKGETAGGEKVGGEGGGEAEDFEVERGRLVGSSR